MAARNLSSPSRASEKIEEQAVQMFLGETVLAKANVMRLNNMSSRSSGVIGTLFVTNFKVAFTCSGNCDRNADNRSLSRAASSDQLLSEEVYEYDDFIPLTVINHLYGISTTKQKKKEIKTARKELSPHYDIIEIQTRDFRIIQYDFKFALAPHRKSCIQMISHYSFPTATSRLFAFDYGKNVRKSNLDTTERVFCTYSHVKDYELNLNRLQCSDNWRISRVNDNFKLCKSLPEVNICPMEVDDEKLREISIKYVDHRFPVWLWSDPSTGAALLISSKLKNDTEFTIHEHPVSVTDSISKCQTTHGSGKTISVEVGSPCPSLRQLKGSFNKLQELCIFHSSKEFWESDPEWLTSVEETGWLSHVSTSLNLALDVAKMIGEQFTSVIVSDADGRNLSILITSLVQIILDPFYRTLIGLQALIQKDWVMKGHPFSKRLGHITLTGKPREGRTASLKRNSAGEKDMLYDGESPVFLLFLECVHQLLRQNPLKFEYTEQFLILLIDSSYSSLFSTFLFDSYFEYRDMESDDTTLVSAWDFIAMNIPQSKYVSVFKNASYKIDKMDVEKLLLNDEQLSQSSSSVSTCSQEYVLTSRDFIRHVDTKICNLHLWTGFLFRWFPCTEFSKGSSSETVLQLQQIQFMDELLYLKDRLLQLNMQLLSQTPSSDLVGQFHPSLHVSGHRKQKHKRNASRFSNNEEVQSDFLNVMTGFHFLKML